MERRTLKEKLKKALPKFENFIRFLDSETLIPEDGIDDATYFIDTVCKYGKKMDNLCEEYGGIQSTEVSTNNEVISNSSTTAETNHIIDDSIDAMSTSALLAGLDCSAESTSHTACATSIDIGSNSDQADSEDLFAKEPRTDNINTTGKNVDSFSDDDDFGDDDFDAGMMKPRTDNINTAGKNVDSFSDDDDFGDDDFDAGMMKEIEDAEKSFCDGSKKETDHESDGEDDEVNQPQDAKYLTVLKQYFGYAKFRPMQWRIVNSVLNNKRDNCVVMATGYGKSLCYQYPSVYTGRTTVVVSPLISLMEDQVLALSASNISACFLGSAQDNNSLVMNEIKRGKHRVVYITPEFAEGSTQFLVDVDAAIGIDLIAIDEAHCVSQWGHDFRSAYRKLGQIRTSLKHVPIMALTATATPQVRADICRSLHLNNPQHVCTGFNRPNLFLSVAMKSGNSSDDLRSQMLSKDGGKTYQFDGQTIIYCPTKKAAEDLDNVVRMLGVKSAVYHAGIPLPRRKEVHRLFIHDKIQVVVATVAFGMGIDKPDVRKVMHFGAPKDIESYYQEIGRAGRDGQPSCCHVFYSQADFNVTRFLLKDIQNSTFRDHKQDMMKKIQNYLCTTKCRRQALLSHFDDKIADNVGGSANCCDNCRKRIHRAQAQGAGLSPGKSNCLDDDKQDFTTELKLLLQAVKITGERYGLSTPILFLRGSRSQRLPSQYYDHKDYGCGKNRSEKWWKSFARQIVTEGLLKEVPISGGFGYTVELTRDGMTALSNCLSSKTYKYVIQPNLELQQAQKENVKVELTFAPKILPMVPSNTWISSRDDSTHSTAGGGSAATQDPQDEAKSKALYGLLLKERTKLSSDTGLPAFALFSNKTLLDVAKCRPTTQENLLKIEDVSVQKAQKYGSVLLDLVEEYCKREQWTSDVMPDQQVLTQRFNATMQRAVESLNDSAKRSYILFQQENKSWEETAVCAGLQTSTVCNHLCEAIKQGLPVDVHRLGVTQDVEKLITDTIRAPPINSDISRMKPIKEQLPDHIQYNHIKVVLSILQRRYGGQAMNTLPADDQTTFVSTDTSSSSSSASTARPALMRTTSSPQSSQDGTTSGNAGSSSGGTSRNLPQWMKRSASSASSMSPLSSETAADKKRKSLASWCGANTSPSTTGKATQKKLKKNSLFS